MRNYLQNFVASLFAVQFPGGHTRVMRVTVNKQECAWRKRSGKPSCTANGRRMKYATKDPAAQTSTSSRALETNSPGSPPVACFPFFFFQSGLSFASRKRGFCFAFSCPLLEKKR